MTGVLVALRALLAERIRLLQLLPRAGFVTVAALIGCLTLVAAVPALNALATGWLVRTVADAARADGDLPIWPLVVVFALLVIERFAQSGQWVASLSASRQIDGWVRQRVRSLILTPSGIAHLEQSSIQDDIVRASDLGGTGRQRSPGTAVVGQIVIMFRVASALLAAVVLARFSILLAVVLLAMSMGNRAILRHQWIKLAEIADAGVNNQRRADYWSNLATGADAATEVRLFGLGDWLMAKRHQATLTWLDPIWREHRHIMINQWPIVLLSTGSALLALLVPGIAAARGEISADELVTYLVAAWGVFGISSMGYEAFDIEYGKGAVTALDRLSAHYTIDETTASSRSPVPPTAPAIRLESVSFAYPGTTSPVLHDLSLEIGAGEVLAIVGHNGAGKTTLVKLLAGLYQPTAGRIVVDGVDLTNLDIDQWRSRIATVFQDFVQYPASARDNIALSAVEHLTDDDGIQQAIHRAGAEQVIAHLSAGLDTPLWRGATGGVSVSGGQWQKIALARVLFAEAHGRRLLILDEPTAHLDVQAEAEFFERVIGAVAGATVVLISHRLSMVRQAHRIIVLDGGRVSESGTHQQLMADNREYARLFRLQAARFTAMAVNQ